MKQRLARTTTTITTTAVFCLLLGSACTSAFSPSRTGTNLPSPTSTHRRIPPPQSTTSFLSSPIIATGSTRLTPSQLRLTNPSHNVSPNNQSASPSSPTSPSSRPQLISDQTSSVILFVVLPLLSLSLPILLNLNIYAALSIAKRVYIYLVAASIVLIGSSRGAADSPNLGGRLQALTSEILPKTDDAVGLDLAADDTRFEELRALDAVSPTAQSAALPAVVVSSLFLSILLLQIQNGGDNGFFADVSAEDSAFAAQLEAIMKSLRSFLPSLVQLSNVAVIGLFVRTEVGRGITAWFADPTAIQENPTEESGDDTSNSFQPTQAILPVSAALVGLAYLAPASIAWPIRNLVCSCLGIGVVRAVQIPKLTPIVAALLLLVVYDVYSVGMMLVELGSQSLASSGGEMTNAAAGAGAATSANAASSTTAASSAMGAVAMSKVDDTSLWQPGLLEVRLQGRVTDLLGLGDAVFPSLLSTYALRFDSSRSNDATNIPYYFAASVAGYGLGCAACEFAPGIGSSGLPALLFIIPVMLTSVLGLSLVRGEFGGIFQYKPMGADEMK